MSTFLSLHCIEQARAKGFEVEDLHITVREPDITYPSRRPGQRRYIRDGVCVVVDVERDVAITCYLHLDITPLRADQEEGR